MKPRVALYVGGMGHRDKNFHKEMMIRRGFGDAAQRIQELFLARRRDEAVARSEEHTSELQSLRQLVCRLLLEKKTVNLAVCDDATAGHQDQPNSHCAPQGFS